MKLKTNQIYLSGNTAKIFNTNSSINTSVIPNHINSTILDKITKKNPVTKTIYSFRNPYWNNNSGVYTRDTSCWLNDNISNISCFSPAQLSGALWYQRGGTLISPRHFILAKHFGFTILNGGTDMHFVDSNNNSVTRKAMGYALASDTDIAVGILDRDVPNNIKFAKVLPRNHNTYIQSSNLYIITIDQEQKASIWSNSLLVSNPSSSNTNLNSPSTSPYNSFWESTVTGDSGQPCFLLIDNELVIISAWWTPTSGPSYSARFDQINSLMDKLGGGYNLTPIDLENVYNKYK